MWWQEGVDVFLSRVCNNQSLFGKSIHVMIWFVGKHHCTKLWLRYDHLHMYHSVIPYVYVDSLYRTLIGFLLHICHQDRSSPAWYAWGPLDIRSGHCSSWWQEGVKIFLSRACKNRSLFCLENPFVSRFLLSVSVLVFPSD